MDGLIYGPVMKAKSHQGLYQLITRLVIDQSVVSYTGPIIVLFHSGRLGEVGLDVHRHVAEEHKPELGDATMEEEPLMANQPNVHSRIQSYNPQKLENVC